MCLAQIPKLEPQIPPISQILRRVSGYYCTNLFVPKLQGVANRNLLYLPCHLRNPWLNLFRILGLARLGTVNISSRRASLFIGAHPWDLRARDKRRQGDHNSRGHTPARTGHSPPSLDRNDDDANASDG